MLVDAAHLRHNGINTSYMPLLHKQAGNLRAAINVHFLLQKACGVRALPTHLSCRAGEPHVVCAWWLTCCTMYDYKIERFRVLT